jgi:hypothetical protein
VQVGLGLIEQRPDVHCEHPRRLMGAWFLI